MWLEKNTTINNIFFVNRCIWNERTFPHGQRSEVYFWLVDPLVCKKIPFYLKVGEAERVDTRAAAVVESAVKGALWDSACLSSGLNVTDDRDHWSFFFHIIHSLLRLSFIEYCGDADPVVIFVALFVANVGG